MLNRVYLMGTLQCDPELLRFTGRGKTVVELRLQVFRQTRGCWDSTVFLVTLIGPLADRTQWWLKKDDVVLIEGSLEQRHQRLQVIGQRARRMRPQKPPLVSSDWVPSILKTKPGYEQLMNPDDIPRFL